MSPVTSPAATVEVTAHDLQGPGVVFCPNPKMPLWSNHPRVFIDLSHEQDGRHQGQCPYCGTLYRLKAGEKIGGH
ncbi:MAG: zinc-finger domain-containing protein [Burkholderiaceae bacterium]